MLRRMLWLMLMVSLAGCGEIVAAQQQPSPTVLATASLVSSPTQAPTNTPTHAPTPVPTNFPTATPIPVLPPIDQAALLVDLQAAGVPHAQAGTALYQEAIPDLILLLKAAEQAGFPLEVRSAYRSFAYQSATFEHWVAYELNLAHLKGVPISNDVARQRASRYSAAPGTSEHQTGLAVDLLPLGAPAVGFQIAPDLQSWLQENAYVYGWVQSYPVKLRDNQLITAELTGFTSEPWHWRWQGRAAAQALYQQRYLDADTPLVPPRLSLQCDAVHDPCLILDQP